MVPTEYDILPFEPTTEVNPIGMYLLNEGNMGSNKASIDFVDFKNAYYVRNMYAERNPTIIKELGDVGNDIQIYGDKIYAVINKVSTTTMPTVTAFGLIEIDFALFTNSSAVG